MRFVFVVLLTASWSDSVTGRILQQRNPKVDPVYLDSVLTEIVDNSMETMRQKLREAIYAMAIKKSSTPALFQHDATTNSSIDAHEEWLLDKFIAELALRRAVPESSPIFRADDDQKTLALSQRDTPLPRSPSHTMSIALETYTVHPKEREVRGKLVTAQQIEEVKANDLEFPEISQALQDDHQTAKSAAIVPFWLIIGFSLTVSLFAIILIICVLMAHYKRKNRFKKVLQMPDPMTITGFPCAPECHHFPTAVFNRIGRSMSVENQRPGAVWPGGYERTFRR